MIFNGSIITTSARLIWNDLDVNNDVMLCSMLGWLDTFRLLLLTWCGWTMAPRTFPHDSEDWGRCQPKYSSPPVMSEGNPEASIGEKKTWHTAENAKKWPIPGKLKEWKMYNVSYRKENLALIIYTFIPTSLEILFINLGGALVNQCEIDLRLVDIRIVSNYSISNGNRENTKKKHAKSIFGTLTLLWDVVGIMSHTYYIPRLSSISWTPCLSCQLSTSKIKHHQHPNTTAFSQFWFWWTPPLQFWHLQV